MYKRLIAAYLKGTTPTAEAMQARGVNVTTVKGSSGHADADMVTINGMTMSAKVAARIGLI